METVSISDDFMENTKLRQSLSGILDFVFPATYEGKSVMSLDDVYKIALETGEDHYSIDIETPGDFEDWIEGFHSQLEWDVMDTDNLEQYEDLSLSLNFYVVEEDEDGEEQSYSCDFNRDFDNYFSKSY